jgi:dolichol-phosphate mannosyltransferase
VIGMPESLAVVMPAYNEEQIIEKTVNEWLTAVRKLGISFELHVYNDGSRDRTLTELLGLGSENRELVIHDKKNSGHGPTILLGYRDNSDRDWVFQVDSDGEMSPEHFRVLWEKRHDYDFLTGKRRYENRALSRSIASFGAKSVKDVLYGKGVCDANCPYRLMRTELFRDCFFSIPSDTACPNIILAGIACLTKYRIYEAVIPYTFRKTGVVSINRVRLAKLAFKSSVQTVRFRFRLRPGFAVWGARA